VGRVV
ncbi:unnamed protein product, partial [Allacma fusca]